MMSYLLQFVLEPLDVPSQIPAFRVLHGDLVELVRLLGETLPQSVVLVLEFVDVPLKLL